MSKVKGPETEEVFIPPPVLSRHREMAEVAVNNPGPRGLVHSVASWLAFAEEEGRRAGEAEHPGEVFVPKGKR